MKLGMSGTWLMTVLVCGVWGLTENIDHIFRLCPITRVVWYLLLPASKHQDFFNQDTKTWMLLNFRDTAMVNGRSWLLIFVVALDIIWQNRSNFIFQGLTSQPADIVKHILSKVEVIDDSLQQFVC